MTPDDLNAMAKRLEAELAKLPVNSLARESLAQAIADLIEDIGDQPVDERVRAA